MTVGETYLVKWEVLMEEYQRFDCHPEEDANETKCKARGCIWKVRGDIDVHIHVIIQPICFEIAF